MEINLDVERLAKQQLLRSAHNIGLGYFVTGIALATFIFFGIANYLVNKWMFSSIENFEIINRLSIAYNILIILDNGVWYSFGFLLLGLMIIMAQEYVLKDLLKLREPKKT